MSDLSPQCASKQTSASESKLSKKVELNRAAPDVERE
jgi:hypothetical protein